MCVIGCMLILGGWLFPVFFGGACSHWTDGMVDPWFECGGGH